MLSSLVKSVAKLFGGTKSEKDIKDILPLVQASNRIYAQLSGISHDELRQKTAQIKSAIDNHLKKIDDEVAQLRQIAQATTDINEKEKTFEKIDKLESERDKELEKVLLEQLPLAFAVVRETAKRFKENEEIVVTASETDKEFSQTKEYVTIKGSDAVWKTTWSVRGNPTRWDMVHYDVQLIGGIALHQGKIAEMATGEGKTLVATLPAFLNALARRGVHIVTVNDYLAKRDSEWMAPIFEFHGLKVDCIDKHQPNSEARRKAYAAHITYGTNNEFGFDYLRDNMTHSPEELVQGKLHYAMIDEVDSILIDDARTPLIISGPVPHDADKQKAEFEMLKPRIERIVEAQKKLVNAYLNEAKKKIAEGNKEEGGLALFRAHRGLPKYKPLIKFLSEPGIKVIMQATENLYLQDNAKLMPQADKPLYFVIDERHNTIDLTDNGIDFLTKEGEDPNFFILPSLSIELDKIDKNSATPDEKVIAKNQLIQEYTEKSQRIHCASQLLKAYTLFEQNQEYIIQDGKVKIVDEQTGRVLEGRRYSDGLHQALEAKENVKVEDATQTYATITLQNFFRMYHKLAGMTGTAETEAGEFWEIYKLDVVVIPTNKPIARKDLQDKVYRTVREKYNAVAAEIESLRAAGRPVLVGTTSVENSEVLARMLKSRGIPHQVLNAKYHEKEAEIVAEAGKPGAVTIATNMAGRGTDIKLTAESKAAGGLAIIGTERHDSRRVDRQLRGRSGRQGDPGSSQFFVSLEDPLMRLFGSDKIPKIMAGLGMKMEEGEVIEHSIITKSIERAQRKVEENNFSVRKRLLEYDNVMNAQRNVIYKRRKNALFGERSDLDIMIMMYDLCENVATQARPNNKQMALTFDEFQLSFIGTFGFPTHLPESDFAILKPEQLADKLYREVFAFYSNKRKAIAEQTLPFMQQVYQDAGDRIDTIVVPFTDGTKRLNVPVELKKALDNNGLEVSKSLEKLSLLSLIDMAWMEHLRDMDDLKQSVQNAAIEQKDPLVVYKFEAAGMFKHLIRRINEESVGFLLKAVIATAEEPVSAPRPAPQARPARPSAAQRQVIENPYANANNVSSTADVAIPKQEPARSEKIANRNDRVTVRYIATGEVKENVKYKTVEQDVLNGSCLILSVNK
jgi:preprotein translocase subunit SecA